MTINQHQFADTNDVDVRMGIGRMGVDDIVLPFVSVAAIRPADHDRLVRAQLQAFQGMCLRKPPELNTWYGEPIYVTVRRHSRGLLSVTVEGKQDAVINDVPGVGRIGLGGLLHHHCDDVPDIGTNLIDWLASADQSQGVPLIINKIHDPTYIETSALAWIPRTNITVRS